MGRRGILPGNVDPVDQAGVVDKGAGSQVLVKTIVVKLLYIKIYILYANLNFEITRCKAAKECYKLITINTTIFDPPGSVSLAKCIAQYVFFIILYYVP